MVSIPCPQCGKDFKTYAAWLKRSKVYCSKQCSLLGRQKQRITHVCEICSKEFTFQASQLRFTDRRFCSKKCFGLGNRSEKNYNWQGEGTSYRTRHHWITLRLGKAKSCVECGLNKIPNGMKRYFQWANISGKHLRDVSDYKSLCVKCHKKFDKKILIV